MSIEAFRLGADDFTFVGNGLSRPECVLTEQDGTIWASDKRGGATRINPDGQQSTIGSIRGEPNGLTMTRDGILLLAEIEHGALYRLSRQGRTEKILDHFEGAPLGAVNFAHVDDAGVVWVTVSTRTVPRGHAAMNPVPDGYILRMDQGGRAVMAATGICFPNEVRLSPGREHLYVSETARGRVVRFPIGPDDALGVPETFGPNEFFPGAKIDGIAFDAEGNLWVVEITRNAIFVITPSGRLICLFEDRERKLLNMPSSVAFGGPDLRTVYLGSLGMARLAAFRSPIPGRPLAHWALTPNAAGAAPYYPDARGDGSASNG